MFWLKGESENILPNFNTWVIIMCILVHIVSTLHNIVSYFLISVIQQLAQCYTCATSLILWFNYIFLDWKWPEKPHFIRKQNNAKRIYKKADQRKGPKQKQKKLAKDLVQPKNILIKTHQKTLHNKFHLDLDVLLHFQHRWPMIKNGRRGFNQQFRDYCIYYKELKTYTRKSSCLEI